MELTTPRAGDVYNKEWFNVSDYQPIIDGIGNVLAQEEEVNYSGDTFVVYGESWDSEVSYLKIGWGSCSGVMPYKCVTV